jgi:hypothetical protein
MEFSDLLSACALGDINLMKHIYKYNNINVCKKLRDQNDILFKTACRYKYIFIAKWLSSLCKDWKIIEITRHSIIFGITNKVTPQNAFNQYKKRVDTCTICLLKDIECVITDCNHVFCNSCLFTWYYKNENTTCPYCRSER